MLGWGRDGEAVVGGMSDSSDDEGWPTINEGWLQSILSSYHGTRVHIYDFKFNEAESALSDILYANVTYLPKPDDDLITLDLVFKVLPRDPFSRIFVTEAQFDLREIKFYTKVAPELVTFQKQILPEGSPQIEIPLPKCFYATYSGDATVPFDSVLVLENLKASGYESVEFSKGLSLEQSKSALTAVAKLHALSLALKVKQGKPLDKRYPFLFQTARATDSYQQLVERGLPQLATFLETRPALKPVLNALVALKPDTKELISTLLTPKEPMALITHTDFWCNNLLFQPDNRCKILDWQMVTYSRPTNDVALLLVSSLPTDLRRDSSQYLLNCYWTEFTGNATRLGLDIEGELGYSRKELDEDFRRSQLLALLLCIGSVDVALGDPTTEQRLLELLIDLHEDGILSKDVLN